MGFEGEAGRVGRGVGGGGVVDVWRRSSRTTGKQEIKQGIHLRQERLARDAYGIRPRDLRQTDMASKSSQHKEMGKSLFLSHTLCTLPSIPPHPTQLAAPFDQHKWRKVEMLTAAHSL